MARITVAQVMAELHDHIDKCERANIASAKANRALAADVKYFKDWLTGVLTWWGRFKRWVFGAVGAIILTVITGSVGSLLSSLQSADAAHHAAEAASPAKQAARDARDQAILIELAKIKQQLGP